MQSAGLHRVLVSGWGDQLVARYQPSRCLNDGRAAAARYGSQEKQPKVKMKVTLRRGYGIQKIASRVHLRSPQSGQGQGTTVLLLNLAQACSFESVAPKLST